MNFKIFLDNILNENHERKLSIECKDCLTLSFNQISEKCDHQNLNYALQYLISQIKYDSLGKFCLNI
jgi:hypothetical protein